MPKYDAFGREIGEDTLAGLGGSDATVHADPAPVERPPEAPAPEAPVFRVPDAPPQPIRVRRTRGLGCLVGLIILAAVVAGPVIGVLSFVDDANDAIDSVTGVLDDVPTVDTPDEPAAPAPPPVGIEGRSMIAPGNVAKVIRSLEGDGVTSVVRIAIWPERLDAEAIKGRRARDVTYRFDRSVERGDASPVNRAIGTVPLADIDPKAPARLVRDAAKRYRVRERGINYLIASADVFSGSGHRWIAYFKNGIYVEGDERGRVVRRIS